LVYKLDFLAGRFYPCAPDKYGCVVHWGKKIARAIVRLSYLMYKPNYTDRSVDSQIWANIDSMWQTCAHVPILSQYLMMLKDHLTHALNVEAETAWWSPKGDVYPIDNLSVNAVEVVYGRSYGELLSFVKHVEEVIQKYGRAACYVDPVLDHMLAIEGALCRN